MRPWLLDTLARLFPAHAGMNRFVFGFYAEVHPVPRTRGDEPSKIMGALEKQGCSPHTRG